MLDTILCDGDLISFSYEKKECQGTIKSYNGEYSYLYVEDKESPSSKYDLDKLRSVKIIKRGQAFDQISKSNMYVLKYGQIYRKDEDIKFNYTFGASVSSTLEEWLPMLNKLADDYNKRLNDGKNC